MTTLTEVYDMLLSEIGGTLELVVYNENPAYGRVEFQPPVLGLELDNPDAPEHLTFGGRRTTAIWSLFLFAQNHRQMLWYTEQIIRLIPIMDISGADIEVFSATRWVSRTQLEIERHGMVFPFSTSHN